jgi:hypothetical protein
MVLVDILFCLLFVTPNCCVLFVLFHIVLKYCFKYCLCIVEYCSNHLYSYSKLLSIVCLYLPGDRARTRGGEDAEPAGQGRAGGGSVSALRRVCILQNNEGTGPPTPLSSGGARRRVKAADTRRRSDISSPEASYIQARLCGYRQSRR